MKKIMKKVLSLALVLALAIAPMTVMAAPGQATTPTGSGTASEPYVIQADETVYQLILAADATVFVQVDDANATINGLACVADGGYSLWRSRFESPVASAADGTATITLDNSEMFMIVNNASEDNMVIFSATGSGSQGSNVGTVDSPKEVVLADQYGMGFLSANEYTPLEAGNEGYYYAVTAPDDGAILVSVSASDDNWNDVGWFYYVNNLTAGKYGDSHWSDDDEPVYTETCPVNAGDEVVVFAATYDPNNMWNNPAGNVSVSFGFAAVGSSEYPVEITEMNTYTAPIASGSQGYNYVYTATENGTLTVTMSDTNANGWQYVVNNLTSFAYGNNCTSADDPVVASYDVAVSAGDEVTIMVNTFDSSNPWSAPAGTVDWTISFAAGSGNQGGGSQGGGNQGGGSQGGGSQDDEINYEEMNIALLEGTNQYAASNMYAYSVYTFEPTEAARYTFSTNDGTLLGIVSNNGMWITTDPSATTVAETSIVWECSGVGQSIWVAALPGTNVAEITITKEALAPTDEVQWTIYDNKATLDAFTLEDNAEDLLYVDIEDDVEDKAVLGDDGYYHLNSANGPILYVDLDDTTYMDLVSAMGYGQLKEIVYESGEVVSKVDYNDAFAEYLAVADVTTGLYPLTEDLMTIYKNVGESQGWYMDGGWVGSTPDAWMFACYYVEGSSSQGGNTTGGTTTGGTTTGGATTGGATNGGATNGSTTTSPTTGDNASVAVWAIVMVVAAGAAFVVAESKKRAR